MNIATLNIQQIVERSKQTFGETALEVFRYQAAGNPIYRDYIRALGVLAEDVHQLIDIPFLPISFFKTHAVQSGTWEPEVVFTSSGTTGATTSKHAVPSVAHYLSHCEAIFETAYGPLQTYSILALLPSYLERSGSGLVNMVEGFMARSKHPQQGYFLYNYEDLAQRLAHLEAEGQKTLLIGVTFGLLDFAASRPMPLQHTIVMETGGMKGRQKELTRAEVHAQLADAFGLPQIHSEYGMTELSSQAYSQGNGIYVPGAGMRVFVREPTDPLSCAQEGSGGLNIIDLANIHTCSFIATEDLGKVYSDGRFEVLGRFDQSDARGCNLMVV
jgi:hypothetical protein